MSNELQPIPPPPSLPSPATPDLLSAFLSGKKPKTLRAYSLDLDDFARFRGTGSAAIAVEQLLQCRAGEANAVVLDYRNALQARGLSTATVARRLAALRSVVKLARTLGRVSWSVEIDAPRVEKRRDVRGPDRDEWKKLWRAAKNEGDGPRARRDRAILSLLYDLALRRAEVCAVEYSDLDLEGGVVAVLGKGRAEKERLTLPKPTVAALLDWVSVRGRDPGPLFFRLDKPGAPYGALDGESVARLVARLGRLAKLARPVRPHGLRHSAITAALDLGCDVRKVRKFSRHAKIETVIRYDDDREDTAGQVARKVAGERR